LKALAGALEAQDASSLEVIEIAGAGSPYAFSQHQSPNELRWHILFPEAKPEELSGRVIRPKLFELLHAIAPDVIIAGAIAFPSGALAVQWGQLHPHCRIIIFDDAKVEVVKRNAVVNFVKRCVYSAADAMLYPAEPWIPTGEAWGFRREQMFFGVDVVDNDFWSQSRPFENPWGNYFVAVGRQIEKKNYYAIVQAYSQYVETVGRQKAYHLVLIGDGPEHERIVQLVETSHLTELVTLLPFMAQSELPAVYQHAKALCSSSSSSETWGLVINEAMACGCPIFASYECGAADVLVQHEVNGYKFHCQDTTALAQYMVAFHRLSPVEQEQMRTSSRSIISHWNLDRFCKGVLEAIDYVSNLPKRKASCIASLIIRQWRGQYHPV
jgi:hypothetical protein